MFNLTKDIEKNKNILIRKDIYSELNMYTILKNYQERVENYLYISFNLKNMNYKAIKNPDISGLNYFIFLKSYKILGFIYQKIR